MPRAGVELQPKCGAKNRAGNPCGRRATPGKTRCNMHGGKSTGPKTREGKSRTANNAMTHGAKQTRESFEAHGHPASYLAALAVGAPDLMELAPSEAEVGKELQFTRMKLMRALRWAELNDPDGVETTPVVLGLVEQIRKLAATQNELRPGGNASGEFKITLNVVGADPAGTTTATPVPTSTEPACS